MAGGLNPIGNLLGKVDANGALLVALDGTSPATASRFFGDASATLPAFSITGDTNTGFGASAADTAAIWAGGTTPRVTVTATLLSSTLPYIGSAGDLTTTAFKLGTMTANTGLFDVGSQTLGYAVSGAKVFQVGAVNVDLATDSMLLRFGSSNDVVLSRGAANRLDLASGDSLNVVGGGGTYMIGGVAGASGTGTVISSITVSGGIITAITVA